MNEEPVLPVKRTAQHTAIKPVSSSPFTEEEIIAANERHDREYGWRITEPRIYTNLQRLVFCYKVEKGQSSCGKKF